MFTEAKTIEKMVIDACVALGWRFVPAPSLPRQPSDVFVESQLRVLRRQLNWEFVAQQLRSMLRGGVG